MNFFRSRRANMAPRNDPARGGAIGIRGNEEKSDSGSADAELSNVSMREFVDADRAKRKPALDKRSAQSAKVRKHFGGK